MDHMAHLPITPCLPLPRKRLSDGAHLKLGQIVNFSSFVKTVLADVVWISRRKMLRDQRVEKHAL